MKLILLTMFVSFMAGGNISICADSFGRKERPRALNIAGAIAGVGAMLIIGIGRYGGLFK